MTQLSTTSVSLLFFPPTMLTGKVQFLTPQMFRYSQFFTSHIKFKFKFISCVLLNCLMTLHYHTCTGINCKSKTVLLTIYFEISLQQSGCTIIKTVITHFKRLPSCIFFPFAKTQCPKDVSEHPGLYT